MMHHMNIRFFTDSSGCEHQISDKEFDMIYAFGYANLVERGINITSVLDICMVKAFTENLQGLHVESLRKCIAAVKNCNPYRCTQEYDNLIQL